MGVHLTSKVEFLLLGNISVQIFFENRLDSIFVYLLNVFILLKI